MLGIVVVLAAFVSLSRFNAAISINDDGVRDQLLARDCADLGRCHLTGPGTSVAGFQQGAAWLDVLVAIRVLGGDIATDLRVVLTLLALSAGTVFVVVWRWIRPSMAFPAAFYMLNGLTIDQSPALLTNPCASAFADVLVAAGILCYGLSGRRRFLMLAAVALGVAVNLHVASVTLVPALVAVPGLVQRRPWRDLVAATILTLLVCLATSPVALAANVAELMNRDALMPGLVAALLLVAVTTVLGPRFRRSSWDVRAWALGFMLVAPFACGWLWLVRHEHHDFNPYYLHPIVGPAATLYAAALCTPFELAARRIRPLRWAPTAVAVALLSTYVTGPVLGSPRFWSVEDAQTIVTQAESHGYAFEDLVFHLQAAHCFELLSGMAMGAAPPATFAPGRHGRRQLRVTRVRDDHAVPGAPAVVVPLSDGAAAVLRDIDSWMDTDGLIPCRVPTNGRPEACADTTTRHVEQMTPERFLLSLYSDTGMHGLDVARPYVARYTIPLVPVAGETRELRLVPSDSLHDSTTAECGWRITRVEGVDVDGSLPARQVRLHSATGTPGSLVVEKPFGTAACLDNGDLDENYPPCMIESSDAFPADDASAADPPYASSGAR